MSTALKKFIEQNIEFIEQGDYQSLYHYAAMDDLVTPAQLTELFMRIDVKPELYMTTLVDDFARDMYGMKQFVVPPNIEVIGNYAFGYNYDLEEVIFTTGNLDVIGDRAFTHTSIRSIILPDTVTELGPRAFSHCKNLEYVELSSGLSILSGHMFYNSLKLETIHYRGTMHDWNTLIDINDRWTNGSNINKVKCSDGVIEL